MRRGGDADPRAKARNAFGAGRRRWEEQRHGFSPREEVRSATCTHLAGNSLYHDCQLAIQRVA